MVKWYCYNNLVSEDRKRIFEWAYWVSCRDWYGRDGECILSRDEICDIIHYLLVEYLAPLVFSFVCVLCVMCLVFSVSVCVCRLLLFNSFSL